MSKEAKQFLESIKQPEQSMGAVEATMEGVRGAVGAFLEGMGQVWDAGKPMFDHGRTEMSAALFTGNAHVMYMKGQQGIEQGQDQVPDLGLPVEAMKQPEVQQEQDRGIEL